MSLVVPSPISDDWDLEAEGAGLIAAALLALGFVTVLALTGVAGQWLRWAWLSSHLGWRLAMAVDPTDAELQAMNDVKAAMVWLRQNWAMRQQFLGHEALRSWSS